MIQNRTLAKEMIGTKEENDTLIAQLTVIKTLLSRYGVLLEHSLVQDILKQHDMSQIYSFLSTYNKTSPASIQALIDMIKEYGDHTPQVSISAPQQFASGFGAVETSSVTDSSDHVRIIA